MIKKLLVIVLITFGLISCGSLLTQSYAHMDELDEPVTLEISLTIWGPDEEVMATHSYRLNDEETLYYVPETVRFDDDIYLNDIHGYYICDDDPSKFRPTWEEVTQEQLREIFENVE